MGSKNLPTTKSETALTLGDYLFSDTVKQRLEMAVPKWMDVDRLLRVSYTAMMQNPKLKQCTAESWMAFLLRCAQLGLEPVLGRCHPVPYQNNKKPGRPLEVQFQPGYQGLLDLAHRSKEFSGISAEVVYDCDDFQITLGTHRNINHVPDYEGRAKAGVKKLGAYAIWVRKDGFVDFEYMPLPEIYQKFRARSPAYQYAAKQGSKDTPWISDEDDMIKKSLLKHSSKYQPASIEIMEAVEIDDMIEIGRPPSISSVLGEPDPTDMLEDPEGDQGEEGVDTSAFYDAMPKDVTIDEVDEYIEVCVKSSNGAYDSPNAFMADVVKRGKVADFYDALNKWAEKKKAPAPTQEDKKKPPAKKEPSATSKGKAKEPPQEEKEPPPPPPPPPMTEEQEEEVVEGEWEEGPPPEQVEEGSETDWPDKNEDGEDVITCEVRGGKKFVARICHGCRTRTDCEAYLEYQRATGG